MPAPAAISYSTTSATPRIPRRWQTRETERAVRSVPLVAPGAVSTRVCSSLPIVVRAFSAHSRSV
ncbi:MAG: hypothetical protein LIO63_03410 [Akkermansia sp.]|nr:hypothetical protein [Akkermansia sp.]